MHGRGKPAQMSFYLENRPATHRAHGARSEDSFKFLPLAGFLSLRVLSPRSQGPSFHAPRVHGVRVWPRGWRQLVDYVLLWVLFALAVPVRPTTAQALDAVLDAARTPAPPQAPPAPTSAHWDGASAPFGS